MWWLPPFSSGVRWCTRTACQYQVPGGMVAGTMVTP